jgi:hypothetical protein
MFEMFSLQNAFSGNEKFHMIKLHCAVEPFGIKLKDFLHSRLKKKFLIVI